MVWSVNCGKRVMVLLFAVWKCLIELMKMVFLLKKGITSGKILEMEVGHVSFRSYTVKFSTEVESMWKMIE